VQQSDQGQARDQNQGDKDRSGRVLKASAPRADRKPRDGQQREACKLSVPPHGFSPLSLF